MKRPEIGDTAPDFAAPAVRSGGFTLSSEVKKTPVLLYFYPVNYGVMCTRYIGLMNEMHDEFEASGIRMMHINPGSLEDHEKWMERVGSKFDHISDTEQRISKIYDMIVTHPEHPKVLGFTNRGFVLVDDEMKIRYIWRADRPNDTVDLNVLIAEIDKING